MGDALLFEFEKECPLCLIEGELAPPSYLISYAQPKRSQIILHPRSVSNLISSSTQKAQGKVTNFCKGVEVTWG
jgi:hypothetical protein